MLLDTPCAGRYARGPRHQENVLAVNQSASARAASGHFGPGGAAALLRAGYGRHPRPQRDRGPSVGGKLMWKQSAVAQSGRELAGFILAPFPGDHILPASPRLGPFLSCAVFAWLRFSLAAGRLAFPSFPNVAVSLVESHIRRASSRLPACTTHRDERSPPRKKGLHTHRPTARTQATFSRRLRPPLRLTTAVRAKASRCPAHRRIGSVSLRGLTTRQACSL